MSNLCSAYLGGGFNLPRFGSKRDDKKSSGTRPQDELYGFLPGKQAPLHRTGTLPVRIKSTEKATPPRHTSQKLTRHRSLLPSEKRTVVSNSEAAATKKTPEVTTPTLGPCWNLSPLKDEVPKALPTTGNYSPTQKQVTTKTPSSSPGKDRLNTSLNSSGNSLNDSGIDSGIDSASRNARSDSSRVGSMSSCSSVGHFSSRAGSFCRNGPMTELNWRLQNSSAARPANIPLWVARDFVPPCLLSQGSQTSARENVSTAKPRAIGVKRGDIVNGLYRTNEWVFVRTASATAGFIPFAFVEPIGMRALPCNFTRQFPECGSKLEEAPTTIHPSHSSVNSYDESCSESGVWHAGSSCSASSYCSSRRYDPDLSVLEDCANVQYFHSLRPRQARDRSPLMMASSMSTPLRSNMMTSAPSQLSMIPHIGSDVSVDGEDDEDVNSLDVSFTSTATESSVFTVTDTGVQLTVLFNYTATEENDISVRKGDVVLELNTDDKDWTWVQTEDGEEGFVPSTYVVNLRKLNLDPYAPTTYL